MKTTLQELKKQLRRGQQPEVEIMSLEGAIYLVRLDGRLLCRAEAPGESLRFPSASAAGRVLGSMGVERGWLIHESPYDEMIGRPDEQLPKPGPLRTPMTFPVDAN